MADKWLAIKNESHRIRYQEVEEMGQLRRHVSQHHEDPRHQQHPLILIGEERRDDIYVSYVSRATEIDSVICGDILNRKFRTADLSNNNNINPSMVEWKYKKNLMSKNVGQLINLSHINRANKLRTRQRN